MTTLSCASVSHGFVFVPEATSRVNSPSPWRRSSASLSTAHSSNSRIPGRIAASNSASIASPMPPLIAKSAASSGVFTSRASTVAGPTSVIAMPSSCRARNPAVSTLSTARRSRSSPSSRRAERIERAHSRALSRAAVPPYCQV